MYKYFGTDISSSDDMTLVEILVKKSSSFQWGRGNFKETLQQLDLQNFLNIFLEDLSKGIDISEEEGLIIVNNEDHTLGNLISRGMQKHSKVNFAGYNLPHPLANKVHFHYKLEKDGNIKKIMEDVVEYYLELFGSIGKLIDKI
jgi:DNA-directed RNA polymerase subunit L